MMNSSLSVHVYILQRKERLHYFKINTTYCPQIFLIHSKPFIWTKIWGFLCLFITKPCPLWCWQGNWWLSPVVTLTYKYTHRSSLWSLGVSSHKFLFSSSLWSCTPQKKWLCVSKYCYNMYNSLKQPHFSVK